MSSRLVHFENTASFPANKPIVADPMELVHRPEPVTWKLQLFVVFAGLCLYAIAMSGMPNLMENEHRMGAYVLDAIRNGHWFAQRDFTGELSSKPPALTWLSALGTFPTGNINRFSLYWPTAAAAVAVALALMAWGKRSFGWEAGFLAAACYLFSPAGMGQMMTVRYDGLLALPVTLAALAAFCAWTEKSSWVWFWLAAAAGTLVKGPLAVLLGGAGLLAVVWERRSGHATALGGSHWRGVLIFFAVCIGWLLLAFADAGTPLLDKLFGRELVGHVTGSEKHETMLLGFYEPPLNFLQVFAPWSLVAVAAFWKVWRRPATDAGERRLERFLTCWFLVGLLIFCVAAHQRSRLILPLVPPAALLAGRQLAGWLKRRSLMRYVAAVAIVAVAAFSSHRFVFARESRQVKKTLGMQVLAGEIRKQLGDDFPLAHVDSPFALQFYLGSAEPLVPLDYAVRLLRSEHPAFVSVANYYELKSRLTLDTPVYEIARWPTTGEPQVRIIGNRQAADAGGALATLHGELLIEMDKMRLKKIHGEEFTFEPIGGSGNVRIENLSGTAQSAVIHVEGGGLNPCSIQERHLLQPREAWVFPATAHCWHGRED